MKKLGILFATVIMIMLFAVSVSAKEVVDSGECGAEGDNVTWVLYDDGELIISGNGETKTPLNKFNEPIFEEKQITKVIVNEGVTSIDNSMFLRCKKIKNIILPDTLIYIGADAFRACYILENLIIPENVETIGEYAFASTNISEVVIPVKIRNISPGTFFGTHNLKSVLFGKNVEIIGFGAFCDSGLKKISIPDNVKIIDANAFESCGHLLHIELPDNYIKIGLSAFRDTAYFNDSNNWENDTLYIDRHLVHSDASDLYNIKDGTLTIADGAFAYNNSISRVIMPDSVLYIGESAFMECYNLESVVLSKNITAIEGCTFGWCSKLKAITIPQNVTSIGVNAFAGCVALSEFKIPSSVTEIGMSAFVGCSNLQSIELSESITIVNADVFRGCLNLKSFEIPYNVTVIEGSAFCVCENLESIVIPESVTSIGNAAFGDCKNLKNVYYTGSKDQWKNIMVGYDNECLLKANIHYNYKEEHSHTYTSTVTKEATCWREGEKTYTCTCGDSYTEAIAKLDHEYRPWETKKNPTCTAPGLEWSYCLLCDNDFEREIPATGHTIIDYTRRATPDSDGAYVTACDVCNEVFKSISFGRPTEYKLSTTKYTYDGKTKTPKLTVETSDGVVLKEGVDYELELPSGRKAVGVYTYRVVFKGNFLGEKKVSYQILPGKTSKITATQSTSAIKLTWKKVTGADGYRVYQYNSKTGKYEKIKTLTGTSYTVKKLKAGTTYKFAVKAYTKDNGETLWASSYKTITTATKPATPTVKATAGSKQATISWNKVTGATGYVVYMQDEFGDYEKLGSTKKTSYTRKKLTKGKTYYFRVRAYKTVDGKNIYGGYKTVKVKVK